MRTGIVAGRGVQSRPEEKGSHRPAYRPCSDLSGEDSLPGLEWASRIPFKVQPLLQGEHQAIPATGFYRRPDAAHPPASGSVHPPLWYLLFPRPWIMESKTLPPRAGSRGDNTDALRSLCQCSSEDGLFLRRQQIRLRSADRQGLRD